MLSDIHLDPFHDPAKFPLLQSSPVSEWHKILAAPASATQAEDFAALQKACKAKGVDTPYELFASALTAMHAQEPRALFVTVSGDLMAHQFDCRFKHFAPNASEADYSAFAAKTVAFVASELRATYPGVPVYFALGNNDSGCKDYNEDLSSAFLADDAKAFATDVITPANEKAVAADFPLEGDYAVHLPAPLARTRLIVLQDIFESAKYKTCAGVETSDPAKQQIAWLKTQLDKARANHEHVWVMAHIPPGVDAYSTFTGQKNVCGGDAPVTFLSNDDFGNTIGANADVIGLVLLGHTHMDEMRFYEGLRSSGVPGKLVPSISPVNGNNPAFTIAQLAPAVHSLKDFSVYAADNQTGIGTHWVKEYSYSASFHQPDFGAASVSKLMVEFKSDKTGSTPVSQAYEQHYFVGTPGDGMKGAAKAMALAMVWPSYVCSITTTSADTYRTCSCPAK